MAKVQCEDHAAFDAYILTSLLHDINYCSVEECPECGTIRQLEKRLEKGGLAPVNKLELDRWLAGLDQDQKAEALRFIDKKSRVIPMGKTGTENN